jgi:hypothetical protein
VSLISSGNRSHEALVTYPVLVCPLVSPSYERDRVTDVALIAELNTAALWQRKACAAKGLTLPLSGRQGVWACIARSRWWPVHSRGVLCGIERKKQLASPTFKLHPAMDVLAQIGQGIEIPCT